MSLLKVAGTTASSGTLYVNDVFSVYLYTGSSSTQTITNGIDLAGKGGLVWLKIRNDSLNNILFDTARGDFELVSNSTAAQANNSRGFVPLSTGFSLGGGQNVTNNTPNTYVSWTFREAAKFFDVVTYTGTGSARTIAHSLGVAPGMIIVKRTDASANWQVYHRSLTSAAYSMQLNLTDAQASAPTVWNSTAPTSSVFSVGTDATVNASGGTYVAYLYAHDTSSTGIIQCGSFTADGTGTGTVTLGWEPQYIMVKKINATGNWVIDDSMRGWNVSGQDSYLLPNSSVAEGLYEGGYPTATGFVNLGGYTAGDNLIYMAIRMPNKPPTTGTQVFEPVALTTTLGTTFTTGFATDFFFESFRTAGFDQRSRSRLTGTYLLFPNTTGAEVDDGGNVKWNNTTVYLGTAAGYSMVFECFKRAPGFFDEVCYAGTGSATTQAHNLTVVPELMIVKSRSDALDWSVYVSSLTPAQYLMLNNTAPSLSNTAFWNNTTPTSTVFSIGAQIAVNYSSYTYVAYLFATLAGISKVGSYTGNGTGQVIACGFSAGARFVLIKRTDDDGNWYTFDSARGLTVGSSPYLLLNSTAAETTGNNGVFQSTGGFTLGATAITTTNIATATYIFLAVA